MGQKNNVVYSVNDENNTTYESNDRILDSKQGQGRPNEEGQTIENISQTPNNAKNQKKARRNPNLL